MGGLLTRIPCWWTDGKEDISALISAAWIHVFVLPAFSTNNTSGFTVVAVVLLALETQDCILTVWCSSVTQPFLVKWLRWTALKHGVLENYYTLYRHKNLWGSGSGVKKARLDTSLLLAFTVGSLLSETYSVSVHLDVREMDLAGGRNLHNNKKRFVMILVHHCWPT